MSGRRRPPPPTTVLTRAVLAAAGGATVAAVLADSWWLVIAAAVLIAWLAVRARFEIDDGDGDHPLRHLAPVDDCELVHRLRPPADRGGMP